LKINNLQLPTSLKFNTVRRTNDEQERNHGEEESGNKKAKKGTVNICNWK
jgi:hypothetical protein